MRLELKRCRQKGERGGERGHGKCCYAIGIDGMENNDFSAVKRNTFGCRFGNVRNLGAMESKGKGRQLKNIMDFK